MWSRARGVASRPDLLSIYAQAFGFESEEHGHHHPEYRDEFIERMDRASVSIIIEVDNWADDPDGWARENTPNAK